MGFQLKINLGVSGADEAEKPNSWDGTKIYIGVAAWLECVSVNRQRIHLRIPLEFPRIHPFPVLSCLKS